VAGSFEHGSEPYGSIKGDNFFDQLNDHHFTKETLFLRVSNSLVENLELHYKKYRKKLEY
jgi:hypothetical protein